jgi:hypothetical protein
MKATLSVRHRVDDSERICFVCDHGMTAADHIGGNGDTLAAAQRAVLARHAATCRCTPELFSDLWESLSHMRASTEQDLADESAARVNPAVLALAHVQLDSMRRHDCPCDPHVAVDSELGIVKFVAFHREGCHRKTRKDRRFRMMDLSAGARA